MKCFSWLFLFVFFNGISVFSQEKYTHHTVTKGETISKIAQHYKVKAEAIYELNPDAVNGIKFKSILLIPSATKKTIASSPEVISNSIVNAHEVLPKETIYGITKQYNLSIEELYKLNPDLEKEGLKIGQRITLSQKDVAVSPKNNANVETPIQGVIREVLPKESYYSIAKQYKISVAELQKANPELENKALKSGQKIVILVKSDSNATLVIENRKTKTENNSSIKEQANQAIAAVNNESVIKKSIQKEIPYVVLRKETYYSIAKKNNITVSELQKANPKLGNKALKAGQKIIIPVLLDMNSALASGDKNVKNEKEVSAVTQSKIENSTKENEYTREVLPKETKYGIAKEYDISVAELEKQNPSIAKKLIIGTKLTIRSSKVMESSVVKDENVEKEAVVKLDLDNKKPTDALFVDQLIQTASDNIGSRYRTGGITKEGFDCSGLMCSTFGAFDINLPRTSIEMSGFGTVVSAQEAQKGDLIFFKTSRRRQINHVGMVVEVLDGEIKFIHSATHGGVMISSTKESYYEKKFAQINRVLNQK